MRSNSSAATTAALARTQRAITSVSTSGSRASSASARSSSSVASSSSPSNAYFDHLAEAAPELAVGQRAQPRGIDQHRAGLVERADEVLALREVDAGLAADRGIDHREQGRGHLHDVDAAVVHRRGERSGIADDTTAERDDGIRTQQPPLCEAPRQLLHGVERLRRLTVGDREDLVCRRPHAQRRDDAVGVRGRDLPAA